MFVSERILQEVGLQPWTLRRGDLAVRTPIDGSEIARVTMPTPEHGGRDDQSGP